jgi:hypothetical protein
VSCFGDDISALYLACQKKKKNVVFYFGDTNIMNSSALTSYYNLIVYCNRMQIKTLMLLILISIRRLYAGPCLGAIPIIVEGFVGN